MLKNKKYRIVLIIPAFLMLGFMREFIFVKTNIILYNKFHPGQNYPVPDVLSFLNNFDYYTVYILKWTFTAAFALLFFVLQRLALNLLFPQKNIAKWLLYFYLILLLLSVIAFGLGYVFGNLEGGYRFSRIFMGILQSPVPLMFLIPVGILKTKFEKAQQ